MVYMHLGGQCRKLPKVFLLFVCLFLACVLISTIISHNPMRAWVSSLQWHVIPSFCTLLGADRVEPKVYYLDNQHFAGRWFCVQLDYLGPALSMDGLEPSLSAFRLCWHYL